MQLGKIEIRKNIISNGIYLFVNAFSLFIVYKLIIDRLGKDALGIWSVLFSFLVVIINSGSAANADLIRKYLENHDKLNSGFIGKLLINSIVLYIIYFIIYASTVGIILAIFIPEFFKQQIVAILIMLAGIFIGLINFALAAILDSTKMNYVKNTISIISTLFFLFISTFLINKNLGITGISLAYFSQFLMLFVLLAIVISKMFSPEIKSNNISRTEIQDLFKSGWKLQLISLITISYDPITKYFLLQNSTLGFIAKFEIANRLINQIRTLIISSNQTLIPNLKISNDEFSKINLLERLSLNNIKILSGLYFLMALCIPFLQNFYFNSIDMQFSLICLITMIGYGFNIMSGSYYFFFLANGKDSISLKAHLVTGLLNFIIPLLFLLTINYWPISSVEFGLLITISWTLALIGGAIVMVSGYFKSKKMLRIKFECRYFPYLFNIFIAFCIIVLSNKINYWNIYHVTLIGFSFLLIIHSFRRDIKNFFF